MALRRDTVNASRGAQIERLSESAAAGAALSFDSSSSDMARRVTLVAVRYSQPVAATVTITLRSILGTEYDAPLRVLTLASNRSAVWIPEQPVYLMPDDSLLIDCPAVAGAAVYGLVHLTAA